ncbi:hypothetical protein FRB96_008549 [Tulasnella sp. 330]|nr:hypothetical protein FRB96_008549 [Tulasnella sp. 330]
MSEYKSSINKLHELDDEAAESLDKLDHELESTALSSVDAAATVSNAETVRCRTPDEEREELLSIVRHVSGFTNCLKSVLFRDLQMAAPGRPVVIVNISSYRSDAIIITQASPPELIPLPRITPSEKDRISSTLEKALKIKGKDRDSGVAEVLRFLWNGIVVQVVERLKEQKLHLGSRIW